MSVKNQVGIKKIIIEKPFFIISGNHISPAIIRFSSFNPMYKTATKLQKVYHVIVFCCCLPGNQSCRTTTKTKEICFS
jgi:hypothetical protein